MDLLERARVLEKLDGELAATAADVFRLVMDDRPRPHLVSLAEAGEGPPG